ncbi:LytTR family DNA-binding domain-containing protein [Pedobacter frigiditerrae]|uniref:LytR/AlgR family response regulator transcription factor n=1 Tax=Pedobacter frigiditerrae TaxID=2530452 RepID=UPI00292EB561|nr:LytTR family DNA-binding domain-containing protein [Pedobacter frigiditerrae]
MKDTLTCIIVDDDDLDRMAVEAELSSFTKMKILGSYHNPIEALSIINSHQPDVLFLDIDMPEINGIDFVKSICSLETINVFITSHPEFALQGFQLKVFDFILKPLETERFESCIKRIYDFVKLKGKAEAYDVLFENEKIIFKEGHHVVNLNANEVIYLEAYGDYTKIVTEKKAHLTLATLSSFLESLPAGKFMRIHRSYVVAINKVQSLGNKCIYINDNIIPVGKTYFKETKKIFN